MVGVLYSVGEGARRGGRGTLSGYPVSFAVRLCLADTMDSLDVLSFSKFTLYRGSQICVVDTPRWIQRQIPLLFSFDYGL